MTETAEFVPVIPGFFPDPSVCRVGEDFYLVNSSFEYVPSVPVWRSPDLVHWDLVGNALDRDAQFPASSAGNSGGIYAPTLRHHDGRFWLITTDVGESGGGQRLFHAPSAAGPWSDPVIIPELTGIDPDLAWTEGGRCLVSYCSWQEGASAIWQAEIDPATGVALTTPRPIWAGSGLGHTEGPHLYRRGDWWYLIVAEGGTERGHGVSVARSRTHDGPFEAAPHNPIYSHRSTEHPVQNVGHLDLVDRADGTTAAVHLGVRPRGATPGFHVNGRETFVAEVEWEDDWPVIRPSTVVLPSDLGSFDDSFEGPHPRWISPGARIDTFTAFGGEGLTIRAASSSGVYARVQSSAWTAVCDLTASGTTFVEVRMDDRHRVAVRVQDGRATAVWTVGGVTVELGSAPFGGAVEIASVPSASHGPDDLALSVGGTALGVVDGRYLSTEVAGGFVGRVIGVRVESGDALVRRFTMRED